MANAIEFPTGPTTGNMTLEIPDNWPAPPEGPPNILVASVPCNVNITWEIPPPRNMSLGGNFSSRGLRLRALAPAKRCNLDLL